MGNIKEPAAILRRVFAVALGDIEWGRSGCPVQLIFDFTDSHGSNSAKNHEMKTTGWFHRPDTLMSDSAAGSGRQSRPSTQAWEIRW